MGARIRKLLKIASAPLGQPIKQLPEELAGQAGPRQQELAELLRHKNGFFAFESALHVFPVGTVREGYDIQRWNSDDLWRAEYGDMARGLLFFAEDIFGEQFCIREGRVGRFNPETGEVEEVAQDLEAWAALLLEDYEAETGYPLAHDWQRAHGRLRQDQRLIPKIPFVAGGAYAIENLYAQDVVKGMQARANLARQIQNLPDGAQVRLAITDE